MKKKQTDSQIVLDKSLKDIESWGILSLMTYMKSVIDVKFDQDRNRILYYQTQDYDDSPLSNLDKIYQTFDLVYRREFGKIYDEIEKKHNEI